MDECLDPNLNCGNGQCHNEPGTYQCICDLGYCGNQCEVIDPCIEVRISSHLISFINDVTQLIRENDHFRNRAKIKVHVSASVTLDTLVTAHRISGVITVQR